MSARLVRRALAAPLAAPAAAVQLRALSSAAPRLSQSSREREARPEGGLRPTGLSPSPRAPRQYSPLTVRLVEGLARVMGYNSTTSTAIRVTSDLYDECAQRSVQDPFWHEGEWPWREAMMQKRAAPP
jgi:cytochrome b pre-mRNA-processing protein 3